MASQGHRAGEWWHQGLRPGPSGLRGLLLPCVYWAPGAHTPDAAVLSPTDRSTRAELIHELMAPASLHSLLDGPAGSATPSTTGQ